MPKPSRYRVRNPEKYKGNSDHVVCRSSWERWVCVHCDTNPDIVEWASEEIVIPYSNPITKKNHRYFPDFYIKYKDGTQKIIEVKPDHQTKKPKASKKKTKAAVNQTVTFFVNNLKWKAASKFCERNNYKFEIWTENTLHDMGARGL